MTHGRKPVIDRPPGHMFLDFHEEPIYGRKTILVEVTGHLGQHLGTIKWHVPWRKYAFVSESVTVLGDEYLRVIADYIEYLTNRHWGRIPAAPKAEVSDQDG